MKGSGLSIEEFSQSIFINETPIGANLALVFGADNEPDLKYRTRHAVDLYDAGYVPKLLFTGRGASSSLRSEAHRMRELAVELGVPHDDVFVETNSINTFQNAQLSRRLLKEFGILETLSTILLISSEWHMRRVLLTTRAYFPSSIRLLCCPTTEGCNSGNWEHSTSCRRTIEHEVQLLQAFIASGALSTD